MTEDRGPILLDVIQAAEMLNISRSTFWTLHDSGRVPRPLRLSPRVIRWRREELAAWVAAGCPNREAWEKENRRP
jgi:predicted DNA-binding transcriptional regulator AlpA